MRPALNCPMSLSKFKSAHFLAENKRKTSRALNSEHMLTIADMEFVTLSRSWLLNDNPCDWLVIELNLHQSTAPFGSRPKLLGSGGSLSQWLPGAFTWTWTFQVWPCKCCGPILSSTRLASVLQHCERQKVQCTTVWHNAQHAPLLQSQFYSCEVLLLRRIAPLKKCASMYLYVKCISLPPPGPIPDNPRAVGPRQSKSSQFFFICQTLRTLHCVHSSMCSRAKFCKTKGDFYTAKSTT